MYTYRAIPSEHWPCGRLDAGQTTCRCKCNWMFVGGKWNPTRLLFLNSIGMIFSATISISFKVSNSAWKALQLRWLRKLRIWHKMPDLATRRTSQSYPICYISYLRLRYHGRCQICPWNLTCSKSRFDLSSSRASVKCTFGIINWWIVDAGLKSEKEIDNCHSCNSVYKIEILFP